MQEACARERVRGVERNLRVINGWNMTLDRSRGRASLRQVLLDLGYNDVYHSAITCNENQREAEMRDEAMQAKFQGKSRTFERKKKWDQLLGHCMTATDTPYPPSHSSHR